MKIIFYDRVYGEGQEKIEFSFIDTIMFGDDRLVGVRRVDEIREDRIVLANVNNLYIGGGSGFRRPLDIKAFGVMDGDTTRFFRCYVIAEDKHDK